MERPYVKERSIYAEYSNDPNLGQLYSEMCMPSPHDLLYGVLWNILGVAIQGEYTNKDIQSQVRGDRGQRSLVPIKNLKAFFPGLTL